MQSSQPFQPWLLNQLRNTPQLALAYLNAALDEKDPDTFMLALKNVTEAYGGIDVVAVQSGLDIPQLHAILARNIAPDALTLAKILQGMKLRLIITKPIATQVA